MKHFNEEYFVRLLSDFIVQLIDNNSNRSRHAMIDFILANLAKTKTSIRFTSSPSSWGLFCGSLRIGNQTVELACTEIINTPHLRGYQFVVIDDPFVHWTARENMDVVLSMKSTMILKRRLVPIARMIAL